MLCNMFIKVVEGWSKGFSRYKISATAILISDYCAIFQCDRYVLHRIRKSYTKVGKDCMTTIFPFKKAATAFVNFDKCAVFDMTVVIVVWLRMNKNDGY